MRSEFVNNSCRVCLQNITTLRVLLIIFLIVTILILVYEHTLLSITHNINDDSKIMKNVEMYHYTRNDDINNMDINDPNINDVIYHNDGYILGNPLRLKKCQNAIRSTINENIRNKFPKLFEYKNTHWFESRESLSAKLIHYSNIDETIKKYNDLRSKIQHSVRNGYNNDKSTTYFHIEKSASSSTQTHLQRQTHPYNFTGNFVKNNQKYKSNCSFTFVRNPLTRFISGYYTVNRLFYDTLYKKINIQEGTPNWESAMLIKRKFKFLNVIGEPERFRAFVNDLSTFQWVFVSGYRHLQHIMSQTGILTISNIMNLGHNISNNNIFFIGKVEEYNKHWNILSTICDDIQILNKDKELKLMPSYGARDYLDKEYLEIMSLVDWKKGDILPAYKALDDVTFAQIINYFYQDYVCFNYDMEIPLKYQS